MQRETYQRPQAAGLTCAVDGELLPPHKLVDELWDELLGVLVGTVHVVSSRDHHRELERPEHMLPQYLKHVSCEVGRSRGRYCKLREPSILTSTQANSER